MNKLALFCLVSTGLLLLGCETTRRSEPIAAGSEGSASTAKSASNQPQPFQPNPAANGGSALPASAPYSGSGPTVTQNVNAAPFLAGGQAQTSGSASAPLPPNSLTSRADGTMSGPNDQPAASTGWGTSGVPANASAAPKPAKKKQ